MKVLFYYYSGAGGGLSNIEMLLRTLAREFPTDEYHVACGASCRLSALHGVDGIRVTRISAGPAKELSRLAAGLWGLRALARELGPDVLWCMNSGSYLPAGVPQVLSLHNAHQVYPLAQACFGASARVRLPLLRWFFRATLAQSDGVIVQTELMRRHVARIPQAPSRIAVIPKSVETADDVRPAPLPQEVLDVLGRRASGFAFTFLYAADVRPAKNHRTLLRATARMRVGERSDSPAWYHCLAYQGALLAEAGYGHLWADPQGRRSIAELLWPRVVQSRLLGASTVAKSLALIRADLLSPGLRLNAIRSALRLTARRPATVARYALTRKLPAVHYLSPGDLLTQFPGEPA